MTRSLVLLGVLQLVQPDRSALVSYFDIADGQVTYIFIIIYIFYYFHSFGDRLRIQSVIHLRGKIMQKNCKEMKSAGVCKYQNCEYSTKSSLIKQIIFLIGHLNALRDGFS